MSEFYETMKALTWDVREDTQVSDAGIEAFVREIMSDTSDWERYVRRLVLAAATDANDTYDAS